MNCTGLRFARMLALACLGLLATGVPAQQKNPDTSLKNFAKGPDYTIEASQVIQKNTPGRTPTYEVRYHYDFGDRSNVYISGLGVVPAQGEFRYTGAKPELEFRTSLTGPVLAYLSLTPTAVRTGPADTPQIADFPVSVRSAEWSEAVPFPTVASDVLQKYFPLGYSAQQVASVNYYVTTFRDLPVPDPQLRSQIALALSQPYASSGKQFEYHVQFIARDRPRLSTTNRYGEDRSALTLTAAEQLLNQFIDDMKKANSGGSRK